MPDARLVPDMPVEPPLDRNALIAKIGRLLVADPAVSDGLWHGYALIVRYGDGAIARRLSGFRYDSAGDHQAATPAGDAIGPAFDDLRHATRVPGKAPWGACVLRLWRDSGRMTVEFEYDTPEQWDVTPATLSHVAQQARPEDADRTA